MSPPSVYFEKFDCTGRVSESRRSQRADDGEGDGGGAEEEAADVGQGLALHHNVVLVLYHLGNSSFTVQFTQVLCISGQI